MDLEAVQPSPGLPLLRCDGITIVMRRDLPPATAYQSGPVLYVAPSTTVAVATQTCCSMATRGFHAPR